jgi:hypothetical protein
MNDTPDPARISYVGIRRPSIMLVRIDPGTEPPDMRIDDLPFTVLRVRHPLPACVRMKVMRPAVVLVGRTVLPRDFVLLLAAADKIGASVALMGGLTSSEGLHDWIVRTVGEVQTRRSQRALWRVA